MGFISSLFGRPNRRKNNPTSAPVTNIPVDNHGLAYGPESIAHDVKPIGMSYWRNINYHAGRDTFLVALSVEDNLNTFEISKQTLRVIHQKGLGINHTGEGIYFSATRHDILYVPLNGALYAVNVFTGDQSLIWAARDGEKLWQIHSSYDETVHSASRQNNLYQITGWLVNNKGNIESYDLAGEPDECQIDKSGQFLIIKEDNYNRIININTDEEHFISNEQGAVGHSDCGFGYVLGENDFSQYAGALDLINLNNQRATLIYSTGIWNMGYVSFTNAKITSIINQKCLITTPNQLISVKLDGSGQGKIICPVVESSEYEYRAKANLCPLGEYAIWTELQSGQLVAKVVRIPNW